MCRGCSQFFLHRDIGDLPDQNARDIEAELPGAKWLQLLVQHIPDKNEHTLRYYGAYSSRYRAKHHPSNASQEPTVEVTEPDNDIRRSARARSRSKGRG